MNKLEQDIYDLAMYKLACFSPEVEKLAILGGGAGKGYTTLRQAFRTLKGITDKYLPSDPYHYSGGYYPSKGEARQYIDSSIGYLNKNPKWNEIMKVEGKKPLIPAARQVNEFNPKENITMEKGIKSNRNYITADEVNPYGLSGITPPVDEFRDKLRQISQEDIDKYMDARHTLYRYLNPDSSTTLLNPDKLGDRLKLLWDGWQF